MMAVVEPSAAGVQLTDGNHTRCGCVRNDLTGIWDNAIRGLSIPSVRRLSLTSARVHSGLWRKRPLNRFFDFSSHLTIQ